MSNYVTNCYVMNLCVTHHKIHREMLMLHLRRSALQSRGFATYRSLFPVTKPQGSTPSSQAPGFLGSAWLNSATDITQAANLACQRCDVLFDRFLNESPSSKSLDLLDEMSATLCEVIDTAEAVRNIHRSDQYRDAADGAFSILQSTMDKLNSDARLLDKLNTISRLPEFEHFSPEQKRFLNLNREELQIIGMDLSAADKQKWLQAQQSCVELESEFSRNIIQSAMHDVFRLSRSEFNRLPTWLQQSISPSIMSLFTKIDVSVEHAPTILASSDCPEAEASCLNYLSGFVSRLVQERRNIASILKHKSFAHMKLVSRMAKSPEEVVDFLSALNSKITLKTQSESNILVQVASKFSTSPVKELCVSDMSYWKGIAKSDQLSIDSVEVSSYLSLSNCLYGVDLICRQAFNCSFTEVVLTNDESHNTPHLRKFELRQLDDQALLGVVYADLHSRDHKFRHSATFPLTCAHVHPDVRNSKQTFGESDFQLPRALLVCNLAPPQPTSAPSVKRPNIIYQVSGKMVNESFLNEVEMVNLYHELGHCLHLLMSRTRFQHLSGTRAALDFIELPSILFEYFCLHEKTIGAFAAHHQTGQPIPDRLIKALRQGRHFFAGLEAQSNIMLAMFDMLLCGPTELFQRAKINVTESPLELFNQLNKALLPKMQQHLAHTHWFTKFGHLTSYASGYYNYLWCTVWASKLWHSSFAQNPLDRQMGMRYRKLVLAQGNAVEARKILSDFLGQCDVSDITDSWVKTDLNGPKL